MSSFFGQLFKYCESKDFAPEENFFTEVLVGVLQSNKTLRVAFVKWLIGHTVDSVTLEAQKYIDGNRFDVWIEAYDSRSDTHHVAVMENKIWAPEGQNQLDRYADHLKLKRYKKARTRTLIYATRHERTDFQTSGDGAKVELRTIHWFEVGDWMREWAASRDAEDYGIFLVHELLKFMEERNMAMNLTLADLSAAIQYHNSARQQLIQILDEVKGMCNLNSTTDNKWRHHTPHNNLPDFYYYSPSFCHQESISIQFGFRFERDDGDLSAPKLSLPSAYFGVNWWTRKIGISKPDFDKYQEQDFEHLENWEPPPTSWDDKSCLLVKTLKYINLNVQGNSLHDEYLDFFETAREDLWKALKDLGLL